MAQCTHSQALANQPAMFLESFTNTHLNLNFTSFWPVTKYYCLHANYLNAFLSLWVSQQVDSDRWLASYLTNPAFNDWSWLYTVYLELFLVYGEGKFRGLQPNKGSTKTSQRKQRTHALLRESLCYKIPLTTSTQRDMVWKRTGLLLKVKVSHLCFLDLSSRDPSVSVFSTAQPARHEDYQNASFPQRFCGLRCLSHQDLRWTISDPHSEDDFS